MSKLKRLKDTDPIDEFEDLDFSPLQAAGKLPVDITEGITPMSDYMNLPLDRLIPYTQKKDSDFKEWPREKFDILVESIKENGVMEAITVRSYGEDGLFEILAGEHRWKASKEAGLSAIPAHVMRDCDDELAESIFSLTNVLRRDNSIRDQVNGWWHYLQSVRFKRKDTLDQMKDEGILDVKITEEAEKLGQKQIYRLARLHELIDPMLDLVDQRHLGVTSAVQISYLPVDQQEELLDYKYYLNNVDKATELKQLSRGLISGKEWSKETIEDILLQKKQKENSMSGVSRAITSLIRKRIPKSFYHMAPEIMEKALDEYLSKHPEYKIQA